MGEMSSLYTLPGSRAGAIIIGSDGNLFEAISPNGAPVLYMGKLRKEENDRVWVNNNSSMNLLQMNGAIALFGQGSLEKSMNDPDYARQISHTAAQTKEQFMKDTQNDAVGVSLEIALLAMLGHNLKPVNGQESKSEDVGGIDLNTRTLKLNTLGSGLDLDSAFDPVKLEGINVKGFVPVIMNIQPLTDLPKSLGVK